jgi:hypothetical protein
MIALFEANIVPMAAAAVIGLLTARWAFRRRPAAAAATPPAGPEKSE